MSTDMFPQGFLDMMEDARWYLINANGFILGPYMSCVEAAIERDKCDEPREWSFKRIVGGSKL